MYWGDRNKDERISELQKELLNERTKRQKVEDKLKKYEVVHQRWFAFLLKSLTLPPPPACPDERAKKVPIVVNSAGASAAASASRTRAVVQEASQPVKAAPQSTS